MDDTKSKAQRHMVGVSLHNIRSLNDMTMQEVSKIAGISAPQVSRIEHGSSTPSVKTLHGLAKAYHTTYVDLLHTVGILPKKEIMPGFINVPIILNNDDIKDPKFMLDNVAHHIPLPTWLVPEGSFLIQAGKNSDGPDIHQGSFVLVDSKYTWKSGDVYAIHYRNQILIGKVYKSKKPSKKANQHSADGVLVINDTPWFSIDHPDDTWECLGRVVGVWDYLSKDLMDKIANFTSGKS